MQVVFIIVVHKVIWFSGTDLECEVDTVVFFDVGDVKVLEVVLADNILLETVLLAKNLIGLIRSLMCRLLS